MLWKIFISFHMFCYQHTEVQNKDKEIFFVTSIVGYIWQDEAVNYGIEYFKQQ